MFHFVRDPIGGMRTAPLLSWPALFSLQIGLAIISGTITSLFNASLFYFLWSLLIFPVVIIFTTTAIATFIYVYFALFRSERLERKRLHSIVTLATTPYFLFHIISQWLAPIDLIGFSFTAALLIVGLVEHFQIQKKTATKLAGAVLILFFMVWIANQIRLSN